MITKQELLVKVIDVFGLEIRTAGLNPNRMVDFVFDQILQYCKPKCIHCYDKGYSTEFYGITAAADFSGEGFREKMKIHILYCTCERGQDLKKAIEKNYDAK